MTVARMIATMPEASATTRSMSAVGIAMAATRRKERHMAEEHRRRQKLVEPHQHRQFLRPARRREHRPNRARASGRAAGRRSAAAAPRRPRQAPPAYRCRARPPAPSSTSTTASGLAPIRCAPAGVALDRPQIREEARRPQHRIAALALEGRHDDERALAGRNASISRSIIAAVTPGMSARSTTRRRRPPAGGEPGLRAKWTGPRQSRDCGRARRRARQARPRPRRPDCR